MTRRIQSNFQPFWFCYPMEPKNWTCFQRHAIFMISINSLETKFKTPVYKKVENQILAAITFRLIASHCWPLLLSFPSNLSKIALWCFKYLIFLLIGHGLDRNDFNISFDSSTFAGEYSSSLSSRNTWPMEHTESPF